MALITYTISSELITSGPRIITPSSFNDDRKVPAALVLPEGKLFFGFKYIPFDPSKVVKKNVDIAPTGTAAFSGEGTSLKSKKRGLLASSSGQGAHPSVKGKEKEQNGNTAVTADGAGAGEKEKEDPWAKLGSGNALKSTTTTRSSAAAASTTTTTSSRAQPQIIDATMMDDDFYEVDDDDEDDDGDGGGQGWDDDDVIEID